MTKINGWYWALILELFAASIVLLGEDYPILVLIGMTISTIALAIVDIKLWLKIKTTHVQKYSDKWWGYVYLLVGFGFATIASIQDIESGAAVLSSLWWPLVLLSISVGVSILSFDKEENGTEFL